MIDPNTQPRAVAPALRRAARVALGLFLLAIVACCGGPDAKIVQNHPVVAPTSSAFQRLLDDFDVRYEAPQEGKAILVNIPAFELVALEDGEPVLRSRVIVGSPRTPTPILETYATAVRFRPTWRPTATMIASGEYRDGIRAPGPRNPLGLAALRLEAGLLVYLHDTNRRELFESSDRARSHGCVRVEQWAELFAWVLDVEIEEVWRLAEGARTRNAPTAPIPVRLGYYTTFPDDKGRLVEHPDIYRLDSGEAGSREIPDGSRDLLACGQPHQPDCG